MTQWNGRELAPVSESAAADIEVWATMPTDSGTLWEALNATMITHDSARIWAIPMFLYGLHYGDTVSVIPSAEGPLVVTEIVGRSGYVTFRVWLGEEGCRATWRSVAETYAERGCIVDVWSERLLALSCEEHRALDIQSHLSRESVAQSFIWEPGTYPEE
ncbi:DUF4265 domain-containing protein [Microbacterium sp. NPDC016588]